MVVDVIRSNNHFIDSLVKGIEGREISYVAWVHAPYEFFLQRSLWRQLCAFANDHMEWLC